MLGNAYNGKVMTKASMKSSCGQLSWRVCDVPREKLLDRCKGDVEGFHERGCVYVPDHMAQLTFLVISIFSVAIRTAICARMYMMYLY